jgi:hypothetical protein
MGDTQRAQERSAPIEQKNDDFPTDGCAIALVPRQLGRPGIAHPTFFYSTISM